MKPGATARATRVRFCRSFLARDLRAYSEWRMMIHSRAQSVNQGSTVGAVKSSGVGDLKLDANTVLIALFSIMPLVDSLNGFLLRGGYSAMLSAGDLYRIGVILVMLTYCLHGIRRGYMLALVSAAAYGLIATLFHAVLIRPGEASVLGEINALVQLLLSPLLIFSLLMAVDNGIVKRETFDKILDNLQWIAPLTILAPYVMGLGYSTYSAAEGDLIGYKAFYYATNGISFMLIALFARAVYGLLSVRSMRGFVVVLFNGAALALIGTKSTLFMLLFAFFIAIYCIYGRKILRMLAAIALLGVVIATIWFFAADSILSFLSPVLGRWDYFSTSVYRGDIIAALTSGRVDQVIVHWKELSLNHSGISILVGMGDMSDTIRICEMDFFDVFFQFGLIGLLALLSFLYFAMTNARKFCGRRGFGTCMLVFFLVYAFVVGHVFNNALSSMVFSLFAVAAITRNDTVTSAKCGGE